MEHYQTRVIIGHSVVLWLSCSFRAMSLACSDSIPPANRSSGSLLGPILSLTINQNNCPIMLGSSGCYFTIFYQRIRSNAARHALINDYLFCHKFYLCLGIKDSQSIDHSFRIDHFWFLQIKYSIFQAIFQKIC